MMKFFSLVLMTILAVTICCSCDTLIYTLRYSVKIDAVKSVEKKQDVQSYLNERIARAYQIAADIAHKYGLTRCDDEKCRTWNLSCVEYKNNSCEQYASPRNFSAPGMLVYTQDEAYVVILFRYSAGATGKFKNMSRELRDAIKKETGENVELKLQ